eukprot:3693969-Rhodomonas_salina.1
MVQPPSLSQAPDMVQFLHTAVSCPRRTVRATQPARAGNRATRESVSCCGSADRTWKVRRSAISSTPVMKPSTEMTGRHPTRTHEASRTRSSQVSTMATAATDERMMAVYRERLRSGVRRGSKVISALRAVEYRNGSVRYLNCMAGNRDWARHTGAPTRSHASMSFEPSIRNATASAPGWSSCVMIDHPFIAVVLMNDLNSMPSSSQTSSASAIRHPSSNRWKFVMPNRPSISDLSRSCVGTKR